MRYRGQTRERSTSVLISTTPRAAVCARKMRCDPLPKTDTRPSLKVRQESFIRFPRNDGTGSSSSRSYNVMTEARSRAGLRRLPAMASISVLVSTRGMCEVGSRLNTEISAGRQLLNPPDLPVHARMLVSPEFMSSCANSRPSASFPSPYTADKLTEKIPNKE